MRRALVWTALCSLGVAPNVRADDPESLVDAIRKVDPYAVLDGLDDAAEKEKREKLRRSIYEGAKAVRRRANEADVAAWRSLKSREDWERLRDARLAELRRAIGRFPAKPEDLQARVTKTIPGDGFEIRNVLFESRPGLHVTANLYVPKPARDSMPGILIAHSHHNPKTQGELQDMGMTWARAGCYVLVIDQLGHGERRSHPFASSGDFDGEFRTSRQDYYFRYMTGFQLHLLGDSLMGWMAWDLMRSVDLLMQQPGIDEDRLILLGAVAGGGDPAGVTAALDDRIDAVVPFNFGGPQPETVYPLPDDAEAAFNYFGGGSWESTRNLTGSIGRGFPHWLIVASAAPRRLIHAHEFAWDEKRDPVWRRYQRIYGDFYGQPDHLGSAKGRGGVKLRPPEATHCNNIGAVHRSQIHPLFQKWFDIEVEEFQARIDSSNLHVLRGNDITIDPPHVAFGPEAAARAKRRSVASPTAWKQILGDIDPGKFVVHTRPRRRQGKLVVTRFTLQHADDPGESPVSVVELSRHDGEVSSVRTSIVWLVRAGLDDVLAERADVIDAQLSAGYDVVLVEPRGVGLTAPGTDRGRRSNTTGVSSLLLMTGRPTLGLQLKDVRAVLGHLRSGAGGNRRFVLWADSLAPVNEKDRVVAVPLGSGHEPRIGEPAGHALALLVGVFEPIVGIVSPRGGLTSFRSALEDQFVWLPHDIVVQGAIEHGDLDALTSMFARRPMKVGGRINARNQRVEPELNEKDALEWLVDKVPPTR